MIISAYEGVIKRRSRKFSLLQKVDMFKDVHAINKFVRSGNEIMIMTRKKPDYMKDEIKKYRLLYNYLSVYNGLVTYDKNCDVINAEYIDREKVKEVIKIIKQFGLQNYAKFYNERGLKKDDNLDDVVLIDFLMYSITRYLPNFKDLDLGYTFTSSGAYLSSKVSKEDVISKALDNIGCQDATLITDASIDIPLIKRFNGYTVTGGNLERYDIGTNGSITLQKILRENSKVK